MCPACIATLALIAVGAASTGGFAALVLNKRQTAAAPEGNQPANLKEDKSGGN